MKILLTGGNGFIGRNMAEALSKKHEVVAPSETEIDWRNPDAVRELMRNSGFDAVVHAAERALYKDDPSEVLESNLRMFTTVTKCAGEEGAKKFVYFGSGLEYGCEANKITEDKIGKIIPQDAYGYQKYLITRLAPTNMDVVNLRCFGVFGKYEDYSNRFISNAICRALYDFPITIRQDRQYSYVYIDDLCAITEQALTKPLRHKHYNVCTDEQWSLMDIARLVRRIAYKDVPINVAKEGKGLSYTGSGARLHREMPCTFTPIYDAVKMLFDWYAMNSDLVDKEKILYHR